MIDKSPAISGVVGLFLGLTWIAVVLRIYIRAFMLKKLQISDYFIFLTQIYQISTIKLSDKWDIKLAGTGVAIGVFVAVKDGVGNPNYPLTPLNVSHVLHAELIVELLFCITSTLLRLSIGLQLWPLIKISTTQEKSRQNLRYKFQRGLIIVIVSIMLAYGITWFFLILFACVPVDFSWKKVLGATGGTCINPGAGLDVFYAQAALCAVSDFILGLLPIWILWSVDMPRRLKFTVAGLLGVGISTGVVAIVRGVYTSHLLNDTSNFFSNLAPIALCGYLELALGILAACVATFRPLFLRDYKFYSFQRSASRKQESKTQDSRNAVEPGFQMVGNNDIEQA